MPNTIALRVYFDGRLVKGFGIDKDLILIGRDPHSDIRLPSRDISRIHARIHRRGEDFILLDEGSSNGTRVNEKHVKEHYLATGDSIQIGRFVIWIEILHSGGESLLARINLQDGTVEPTLRQLDVPLDKDQPRRA